MADVTYQGSGAVSASDFKAVKCISFSVKEGSLFAFLGPNGAGKSTTIDTLCTLLACQKGDMFH